MIKLYGNDTYRDYVDVNKPVISIDSKGNVLRDDDSIIQTLKKIGILSYKRTFYQYDQKVYVPISGKDVWDVINLIIRSYKDDYGMKGVIIPTYRKSDIDSIVERIHGEIELSSVIPESEQLKHGIPFERWGEFPNDWETPRIIAVNNGLLRIHYNTGKTELLGFNQNVFTTTLFNVEFKDDPSSEVNKIISEIIGNDDVLRFFYAFMGWCMFIPSLSQGHFLQISGTGGGGKSLIMQPFQTIGNARKIIPNAGLIVLQPEDLNQKFRRGEIKGKWAVLFDDTDSPSSKEESIKIGGGIIKTLTTGGILTKEHKNVDPEQFINRAVPIFISNNYIIDYGSSDSGLIRRIHTIVINNPDLKTIKTPEEMDHIASCLKSPEAAAYVFRACLDEFLSLKKYAFDVSAIEPESMLEAKKYATIHPTIIDWIDEIFANMDCAKVYIDGKTVKDVFNEYEQCAISSRSHPLGKKNFNKELGKLGFVVERDGNLINADGKRTSGYVFKLIGN